MKKLICAIMFLLSLPAASVHAQAFKEMTFFELSAGSGVKHHGITPVEVYRLAMTINSCLHRAVHLETRLDTELNGETLVEIYVGEDRHIDVVEL